MKKNSYIFRNRYKITAILKARGVSFPYDHQSTTRHNRFTVRLTDTETKKFITFPFYDSHNNWVNGVEDLDSTTLKEAFEFYVMDAIAAEQPFESFMEEFGYRGRKKEAFSIYNACEKANTKLSTFFNDLYEVMDELQDIPNINSDPF